MSFYRTDTDTQGGEFYSPVLHKSLFVPRGANKVCRQLMQVIPQTVKTTTWPKLDPAAGDAVVYYPEEGVEKTESKVLTGSDDLTLKPFAAIFYTTDQFEKWDQINAVERIIGRYVDAILNDEERVFLEGSTVAGDPFNGIANTTGVQCLDISGGDPCSGVCVSGNANYFDINIGMGMAEAHNYDASELSIVLSVQQFAALRGERNIHGLFVLAPNAESDGSYLSSWGAKVYKSGNLKLTPGIIGPFKECIIADGGALIIDRNDRSKETWKFNKVGYKLEHYAGFLVQYPPAFILLKVCP